MTKLELSKEELKKFSCPSYCKRTWMQYDKKTDSIIKTLETYEIEKGMILFCVEPNGSVFSRPYVATSDPLLNADYHLYFTCKRLRDMGLPDSFKKLHPDIHII